MFNKVQSSSTCQTTPPKAASRKRHNCGILIIGCSRAVAPHVGKCMMCRKNRRSTQDPKMATCQKVGWKVHLCLHIMARLLGTIPGEGSKKGTEEKCGLFTCTVCVQEPLI